MILLKVHNDNDSNADNRFFSDVRKPQQLLRVTQPWCTMYNVHVY